MLSQKISTQVQLIAYSMVSHMFALLQNPEMRGDNFSWAKFPEMMEEKVKNAVFNNLVIADKSKQIEAQKLGSKLGKQIAKNMVTLMTSAKLN